MFLLLACAQTPSTDRPSVSNDSGEPALTSSPGCGLDPAADGQVSLDAGDAGGGTRGLWLSLPDDYDPDTAYAVVVGYAGTDWVGEQIQPYLGLEGGPSDTIFVYPDPLWRQFDGWGTYGGWVLGPNAAPADGMEDLVFTEAVLDYLEATYCVDTARVFSTGHSWGGDMSQVASCYLGDRFTASVPVAANRPYWFEESGGWTDCVGDTAVWTMFGVADDHFTWQSYPGEFGDECVDFWTDARSCGAETTDLGLGQEGECVTYAGCDSEVRYCLYGPQSKHQIPSYYSDATMTWFRSF